MTYSADMADDSVTRYLADQAGDIDPGETAEWRDAFLALVATHGPARARFILDQLAVLARSPQVGWSPELVTPYVNTVPVERQPVFPGDLAIEEKLASLMRWNALAMVARANCGLRRTGRPHRQLCQRGRPVRGGLQPLLPGAQCAARRRPGVLPAAQRAGRYARAFLEGRLTERTSRTTARRSARRRTARAAFPAIRIPG